MGAEKGDTAMMRKSAREIAEAFARKHGFTHTAQGDSDRMRIDALVLLVRQVRASESRLRKAEQEVGIKRAKPGRRIPIERKCHDCVTCEQCDQHCLRSAGQNCGWTPDCGHAPCKPVPECFRCGKNVCRSCSSIRNYHWGTGFSKRRLCNDCQVEMDDSPYRVVLRIARKAGYPHKEARRIARERCA